MTKIKKYGVSRRIATEDMDAYRKDKDIKISAAIDVLLPFTRLTIVTEEGRVFEKYNIEMKQSIQDCGKTLKLFIKETELKYQCINCDNKVNTKRTLCSKKCHDEFYEEAFDLWN